MGLVNLQQKYLNQKKLITYAQLLTDKDEFWRPLMIFANSLDPDEAPQDNTKCLTLGLYIYKIWKKCDVITDLFFLKNGNYDYSACKK